MACAGDSTVSSKLAVGVKERLESLVDNVKIVKKQMKTGSTQLSSSGQYGNFSMQHYWSDLTSRVTMVSDWCTKLAVFFSKPPAPKLEECAPVIHAIENSVLTMISSYYRLPPSQGTTLGKELQEAMLDILTGVESLAVTIIRHGYDCQFERMKETGSVWNSCDKISAGLSKDNRAAVLRVFIANLQLLQDACIEAEQIITDTDCMDELEQALNGSRLTDDDDVDHDHNDDVDYDHNMLSDNDKNLIQNSIEFIKVCPKCVANISRAVTKYGDIVTCHGIEQLDAAATVVMTISPCVDDLVTTLYPPITMATVVQSAAELKDKLLSFLEKCSDFDFCKMAEFVKLDDTKKEIIKTFELLILK